MISLLLQFFPTSLLEKLPHSLLRFIKRNFQSFEMSNWEKNGKPVPPPHLVKVNTIKRFQQKYNITTFIETGTYMGDMISEVKSIFSTLYTIELSEKYFIRAKKIFHSLPQIHCIQGDSAKEINTLLKTIKSPCLFWLDAHYSGGQTAIADLNTPIMQELRSIAEHKVKKHVVLIDDARLFVGNEDYPTLMQMKEFVEKKFRNHVFRVKDDIIQILPKK